MFQNRFGFVLILLTTLSFATLLGSCPPPNYTPHEQIEVKGEAVLIVTHPSSSYDELAQSKIGTDRVIAQAKASHVFSLYLTNNWELEKYFYWNCEPTYFAYSLAGGFSFLFDSNHVVTAGGYMGDCHKNTVLAILSQFENTPRPNARLTYVADAVYVHSDYVESTDRFYSRWINFTRMVGSRSINLYQMFQVIGNIHDQIIYLTRFLDSLAKNITFHNHSVVIELNGKYLFTYIENPTLPPITINFATDEGNPF